MANLQGRGVLIGYDTYTKTDKETDKVISQTFSYTLLNGTINPDSGLYSNVELVVIRQEEPLSNAICYGQIYEYDVETSKYWDKVAKREVPMERKFNLRPLEGQAT